MDARFKTLLNKLMLIISLGFGKPQALHDLNFYHEERKRILADTRAYVPLERTHIQDLELIRIAGMWVMSHGSIEQRRQLGACADTSVKNRNIYYKEFVAARLRRLAHLLSEPEKPRSFFDAPAPLGIHDAAINDVNRFVSIFLLGYNNAWMFDSEKGVDELLRQSADILDNKVPTARGWKLDTREERFRGFVLDALNRIEDVSAAFIPPDTIELSQNGSKWRINGYNVSTLSNPEWQGLWCRNLEAAGSALEYFAYAYRTDVAPRLIEYAEFYEAC